MHFISGDCNKFSFSNLPAVNAPVNQHHIRFDPSFTRHSRILHFAPSEDQTFQRFKTFLLHNSEQFDVDIIEIHFIWGNYDKASFSNLRVLKTSVDRHRTWRNPRRTRHSRILHHILSDRDRTPETQNFYFLSWERQVFTRNVLS